MSYVLSLLNAAAIYGALAALQALILNRLGLAFAAMPAFLGLGAYTVAAYGHSPGVAAAVLGAAVASGVGMALLANRLRKDHYLLATLAILECLGAVFGSSRVLGGREGLAAPHAWAIGGNDFEAKMLPWTIGALVCVTVATRFVLNSGLGVAVDRIREHPDTAGRWFPDHVVRRVVVGGSLVAGGMVGILYLAYYGRVSPNVFSLESAVLVLVFTVLGGRQPELAAAAALLYWSLPYFLTVIFSLSEHGAADLLRIGWGALVVFAVCAPRNGFASVQK